MVLNLANKEASDIQYDIIDFSDTQRLLKLIGKNIYETMYVGPVTIISRFQWSDLQLIIQAVAILKDAGFNDIILKLPYMLGARSDRNFSYEQETHYMREVIAPLINNLGARRVFSIDPHSSVVEGCIKGFNAISVMGSLVSRAVKDLFPKHYCLVPPDLGAEKRVSEVEAHVRGDARYEGIIQCVKHRDISTGKITSLKVLGDPAGLNCIIVDDLCDGGRTFIEVSKALKAKGAQDVYLCVAHGLFSQGYHNLLKHINGIYTTNSYQSEEAMYRTWLFEGNEADQFNKFIHVTNVCI